MDYIGKQLMHGYGRERSNMTRRNKSGKSTTEPAETENAPPFPADAATATKPPRKPREIWPIKLQRYVEGNSEPAGGPEWADVDERLWPSPADAKASIQPGTVGTFRLIRVGPTFRVSKKVVESVLFE